jgi:hypothetical protein
VHECALVEAFEEFGYVLIDLDAAGVEEFLAGPAAGGDADGADACFAGGFGVVGGVAEGEDVGGFGVELVEGGGEDVGVGAWSGRCRRLRWSRR